MEQIHAEGKKTLRNYWHLYSASHFTCFAEGAWSEVQNSVCEWLHKSDKRINQTKTPRIWKHETLKYRQLKMGGERYLDWKVLRCFHWWDKGYVMVSLSKDHHECLVTREQGLWSGRKRGQGIWKEQENQSFCFSVALTFQFVLVISSEMG